VRRIRYYYKILDEVMTIPIIKSSEKDVRRSLKRHERNTKRKQTFKHVVRQIQRHGAAGETAEATGLLPQLMQALDKAAKHHSIHPNKAARTKSRLMRRLQRSRQ
jgi:small subunit ribosomal protein S20